MSSLLLIVAVISLAVVYNGDVNQDNPSSMGEWIQNAFVAAPPKPVGQEGEWHLIFREEFDGTSLNETRWTTCYWWDDEGCTISSNNELQWYQPDDVSVEDGMLRLRAQERTVESPAGDTFQYTSGMISSGRSVSDTSAPLGFSVQYGYMEMRAKVPSDQGLWPAFWMLPVDHTSKPEIDVMEILGHEPDTIRMHVHFRMADGESSNEGQNWTGPDFSEDWHVFAVDWRPDALVWYVDGVERWRFTDLEHMPATQMYLLANLAVGGDWPGAPDSSTRFPAFFDIDYIRVWKPVAEHSVWLPFLGMLPVRLGRQVAWHP